MLSVLSLPADLDEWQQTLLLLPQACQDAYFTPEYLLMHKGSQDDRLLCLKYVEGASIWFFPFLWHPIKKIGSISFQPGWFDLESAYGYSGPLCNSDDQGFIKRATMAGVEWAQSSGVVAQFTCFHPILRNERWMDDPGLVIQFDRPTASTDLINYSPEAPFFSKAARNIISRGRRAGIEVRLLDVDQGFSSFVHLYQETMQRLGADEQYYFNGHYFNALQALIENSGFLCAAFYASRMVAAALFFQGRQWVHYHLSASDYDFRQPGAMNLILDRAFTEAQAGGFARLHLGGGRTVDKDDSLLKFKKSMATDIHDFNIGKRVYNSEAYEHLVSTWKREFPHLVEKYQHRLLCYRYH